MKRVAVFGLPIEQELRLGDFVLFPVGRKLAWSGSTGSIRALIARGLCGTARRRLILEAAGVDELYRRRDRLYMSNCQRVLEEIGSADAVVFYTYPFVHPELLLRHKGSTKYIMGFVDDPHSTYVRGLPYAWAYDGVFYISPSYSHHYSFDELLARAGIHRRYWLPLVQPVAVPELTYDDILRRPDDMCYVGNPTFSKVDRLAEVKRAYGDRFVVHGRWPFRGFAGFLRPLIGERGYLRRVAAISPEAKRDLYLRTKIALNMHVSDDPAESGNMRTYEAAFHGMMLLCDRGAKNLQTGIFEEGTEAVYYDGVQDAIEKAGEYLRRDDVRAAIAFKAYQKARQRYSFDAVWRAFCEWIFESPPLTP